MRANTKAIQALPGFSIIDHPKMGKWARMQFPSVRASHDASRTFARTTNERVWASNGSDWQGLGEQSLADFDRTGIAQKPLALVQAASAQMPKKASRVANPHAAMTGGYWDTPSVLAGLPLAARTRKRAKLPPRDIKLAFFLSAGIDENAMAKECAKIARAIWDYTLAGGAVNLTVAHCGLTYDRAEDREYRAVVIETRVNCADVAALAMVLSPVNFRAVSGPLITATTLSDRNTIPGPDGCPLPGYIWCGGIMRKVFDAMAKAHKLLEITEE